MNAMSIAALISSRELSQAVKAVLSDSTRTRETLRTDKLDAQIALNRLWKPTQENDDDIA